MPRTRRAPEDRRRELADAALRCAIAAGALVPAARVASEAGVSEALVHHYFPDREGLWLAAVLRAGSFASHFATVFADEHAPRRLVEAYAALPLFERQALVWLNSAAGQPGVVGDAVREAHREGASVLAAWLLARGVPCGHAEPRAAGFLGGLFHFLLTEGQLPEPEWNAKASAFAASWVALCLQGGSP